MIPAEVQTVEVSPGRWQASILYAGRPTSFTCTHLHHSPDSADRCHRRTRKAWDAFRTHPTFELHVIQTDPWSIFELRRGPISRRFRFLDQDR